MQLGKICILSFSHVCNNPRSYKEASALADAGFEVHWLGAWHSADLAARDVELVAGRPWRFTPAFDWTRTDVRTRVKHNLQRVRRRAAHYLHAAFGWEDIHQLGHCLPDLVRLAEALRCDLYIAHSEAALWVAAELQRRGQRVGVDMEDWFSEDLLPEARRKRPLRMVRALERQLLRESSHRTCTSNAMSQALVAAYGCRPLTVIYNAFPWSSRSALDGRRKDRKGLASMSLYWFSQTLGPGRGLEELIEALPQLHRTVEVHLRGAISNEYRAALLKGLPTTWQRCVIFHLPVPNDMLLSRIAEHDVGLALEQTEPANKNVTISNKILHYLLGGLAVVASDTLGHREVAGLSSQAVRLFPSGNAAALADAINALIADEGALARAKAAALASAKARLCWEQWCVPLVASVSEAMRAAP